MTFADKVTSVIVGIVILALLALIAVPVFKCITADGKIQYCYVETERHQVPNQADIVIYRLSGFRPWRSDRVIDPALKNMDEVRAEAAKYGCELR